MVKLSERIQSLGEEIANAVSHGVGALAAIAAAVVMIVVVARRGIPSEIVGASVFATTMILVYVASTLYHSLAHNRAKKIFRILDHSAIYLLIAGTYTPFTLGVLRGALGWTLFGLVWGLAILGVVFTAVSRVGRPTLSTIIYLAMGWLFVAGVKPLWTDMEPWGLFWLAAGGIAYTVGVAFFAAPRLRYGHLVWHLFVMIGTGCHYIAVLFYAR